MLANFFRDRFEICPEIREQARSYRAMTSSRETTKPKRIFAQLFGVLLGPGLGVEAGIHCLSVEVYYP